MVMPLMLMRMGAGTTAVVLVVLAVMRAAEVIEQIERRGRA